MDKYIAYIMIVAAGVFGILLPSPVSAIALVLTFINLGFLHFKEIPVVSEFEELIKNLEDRINQIDEATASAVTIATEAADRAGEMSIAMGTRAVGSR